MAALRLASEVRSCRLLLCLLVAALLPFAAHCITNSTQVSLLQSFASSLPSSHNLFSSWVGDPCQDKWPGISCNYSQENSIVTAVSLQSQGLTGRLPVSLFQIDTLQTIDLSLNLNISGPIPSEVSSCTNLKNLYIYGCSLSGSIPKSIGQLPLLFIFDVHNNSLTGSIPESVIDMIGLYYFDISINHVTGAVPHFPPGTTLGHLHLQDNLLTAIDGKRIGQYTGLVHLLLSNNRLNQTLKLAASEALIVIDVSNNTLYDVISHPNLWWPNLQSLTLQNCRLPPQPLPDFYNMTYLLSIDLSFNSFTGPLPVSLASDAPSLITVNLARNNLSGPFPQSFAAPNNTGLTTMQAIILSDNQLSGPVPFLAAADRTLPLLLSLYDNHFTSLPSRLLADNHTAVLMYGNDFCVPFENSKATLCSPPTELPVYSPPVTCPNVTCPRLYAPSSTCQCASPAVIAVYFTACPYTTFSTTMGEGMAFLFAKSLTTGGLEVDASQVVVESITSPPPSLERAYIHVTVFFFPPNSQTYWSSTQLQALQRGMSTMRRIEEFGPFHVSSFESPDTPTSTSSLSTGAIVGIAVASAVAVLALIAVVVLIIYRRKHPKDTWDEEDYLELEKIKVHGCRRFTLEELAASTDNFSDSRALGKGSYGTVYHGILPTGEEIAVKRAKPEMRQRSGLEFKTEIELLSSVRHNNLVALLGFCREDGEQLLVYEYVAKGTLRALIGGRESSPPSWEQRMFIALGAAKALAYLHYEIKPPIVHRDIKTSNILVTDDYDAKVADFGISKFKEEGEIQTVVRGTPGCMDPEYIRSNLLTEMSDVFSFGVVLLELATGLRPIVASQPVRECVAMRVNASGILAVLDPNLKQAPPKPQVFERFLCLGMHCSADRAHKRPDMRAVLAEMRLIFEASMGRGSL